MTEKINLEITDRRFSTAATDAYELNVLVGTDGMSYMAADGAGEVLALKAWRFVNTDNRFREVESAIRNIFAGEEKIGLNYGRVRTAVYNHLVTLIPNRLFNPGELSAYFNLLIRPESSLTYFYDDLRELDSKVIFAVDSDVARLCDQYFPKSKVSHSASALLLVWHKLAKRNDYEVFVNLRNQIAQIAVFDRKNLLFYNSFAYAKAADFLYFVLLAYDQLRLNPQEIPLNISGELLEDSEIYRLLHRYVRDLRFVQAPDYYTFPGPIQSLPGHFNFDLYAMKMLG